MPVHYRGRVSIPEGRRLATVARAGPGDSNHRVIVVDPKTDRIVWQYGETGKKGREPGRLNTPDRVDLAPPYSLLMQLSKTMGTP